MKSRKRVLFVMLALMLVLGAFGLTGCGGGATGGPDEPDPDVVEAVHVDSVEELLARIRVAQRRLTITQTEQHQQSAVFTNGELTIDYAAGVAHLADEQIHLTPIEYRLLCLLAANVGKVLTHTFITQKIWGSSWENDIASLRVFMATLRKKLESNPDSPRYIQTHIGVGYRMLRIETGDKEE